MSMIKKEAARCLKCKNAQCAANCPVSTEIPKVMELFLDGQIKKAGEMLFANNPLSAVTSVICPHERNCSGHCVLGIKGDPVHFFSVEEYISKFYLETMEIPEIEKNGIKVAVAGAGPAGITMSILLLMNGYDVTLFEAQDSIGGVLRYGIPPFRLPKDILDVYKDILIRMGVNFRPNTRIGTNIMIQDLFPDGYKAVFIASVTGRQCPFCRRLSEISRCIQAGEDSRYSRCRKCGDRCCKNSCQKRLFKRENSSFYG